MDAIDLIPLDSEEWSEFAFMTVFCSNCLHVYILNPADEYPGCTLCKATRIYWFNPGLDDSQNFMFHNRLLPNAASRSP